MNGAAFLDLMNGIDDSLLARCEREEKRTVKRWRRPLAVIAAMLAVALIGGGAGIFFEAMSGAGAGSGGRDGLTYMHYVGPVLPLSAVGESDGITAARHTDYDFSPYADSWSGGVRLTDRYTLTNTSADCRTLTLAYPLSETMSDYASHLPAVTVDGKTVEITYYPGAYSGGYAGVWGAKDPEGTVNLAPPSCFEDYRALLSDGSYMEMALSGLPTLDQPVTVYELTDPVMREGEEMWERNPTLAIEFYSDPDRTVVMTYGMNSMHRDPKRNFSLHGFGIHQPGEVHFGEPEFAYVILLGEDIEGYTLQGYEDGGCDRGEEIDITATVNRYEMTLGEFLAARIAERRAGCGEMNEHTTIDEAVISNEVYLGLAADLLLRDGILSENGVERYRWGMLEDILSAVRNNDRLLYLTFDVTIPAGASVEIECAMHREAHMDYVGDKIGVDGYDQATRLGSSLHFASQSASVTNAALIEIIGQNFGFDPEAGITEVTLDLNVEHYWMEVRRRADAGD